ncbi:MULTISPECIES: hypothetical protein [Streptomyces]|uniref:hypothetical protein n=1 Tax=Streptomyces TaxID=1883 RepID=UPI00211D6196|nr:hypothetical protein [Streptomyces sp. ms115]
MAFRRRSLWASGIIGAAALIFAVPLSSAAGPTPAADDELPPSAVEDFAYPGADRILETRGIELKRGDGRIVLTDCDLNAPQIRVMTVADPAAGREGTYCFRATAATGFLTLSLPRVFALEAADRPISADLTADGETTTVDVPKGGFESVGEGTPGGARSVLVELRVTG